MSGMTVNRINNEALISTSETMLCNNCVLLISEKTHAYPQSDGISTDQVPLARQGKEREATLLPQ